MQIDHMAIGKYPQPQKFITIKSKHGKKEKYRESDLGKAY